MLRKDGGGGTTDGPNINRDAVDVRFKLRSPFKIAFDMNAESLDKKIKTCIVLLIFEEC